MSVDQTARATTRTWAALAVLLLPAMLVAMDLSILFVAAPAIAADLNPTAGEFLWIMDIYGFVLAGLLITMGGLGDRIGRKRLLLAGAALFGVASVAVASATDPPMLIAARAALGVAGATLAPSTMALIRDLFTDERQRRTAIGLWTIAFSGGAVLGPIVGGALLEHFPWGVIFLINVPVMTLILIAVPILVRVPRHTSRSDESFDLIGAATSLGAVLALVYAMKTAASGGPTTHVGLAAGICLLATAAFIARQRTARHPLIDLELFGNRSFAGAVAANTVIAFSSAGLGLLAFTLMQSVHGLSPLHAALVALPTFLGTIVGATVAASLPGPRPRVVMAVGLFVTAAGFMLIAFAADGSLWITMAGYTVVTTGVGAVGTTANSLILTGAPAERAGTASGISESSTELGAALGIAVLGTIATATYTGNLPDASPGRTDTIATTLETASILPEEEASRLTEAAFAAYTAGVTAAALTGAALVVLIALIIGGAPAKRRRTTREKQTTDGLRRSGHRHR